MFSNSYCRYKIFPVKFKHQLPVFGDKLSVSTSAKDLNLIALINQDEKDRLGLNLKVLTEDITPNALVS